jgi:hypothetical protein
MMQTYRANLVRLGLLQQCFKRPGQRRLPEFSLETGMIASDGYNITQLGRLLLGYLGITEEGLALE